MEARPVLSLCPLHIDLVQRNPGSSDTAVGCYCQGYGKTAIYVDTSSGVGMFPIRREAAGYAFKRSLRLHAENAVHQEYGGGYISALLETTL